MGGIPKNSIRVRPIRHFPMPKIRHRDVASGFHRPSLTYRYSKVAPFHPTSGRKSKLSFWAPLASISIFPGSIFLSTFLKNSGPAFLSRSNRTIRIHFDKHRKTITLGRTRTEQTHPPDILLARSFISGRHAAIHWTGNGQLTLQDLASSNGTWIWNGAQWEELNFNQKYLLRGERYFALGKISDKDIKFPRSRNVLLLILTGKEGSGEWTLSLVDPRKPTKDQTPTQRIPLSMVPYRILEPKSGFARLIARFLRFFSAERKMDHLNYRAGILEKKGKLYRALPLHSRSIQLAINKIKKAKDPEKRSPWYKKLGHAERSFAEFWNRQERYERAADHFELAWQAYRNAKIGRDEYLLMIQVKNKALEIYKILLAEKLMEEDFPSTARYYEKLSQNIADTEEFENKHIKPLDPLKKTAAVREIMILIAKAAFYFKKAGPKYSEDLQRVLKGLEEKGPVDSKIKQFIIDLKEGTLTAEDVDWILQ